jgi:hypothetical protein
MTLASSGEIDTYNALDATRSIATELGFGPTTGGAGGPEPIIEIPGGANSIQRQLTGVADGAMITMPNDYWGKSLEISAPAMLSHWWTNRFNYFRGWENLSGYPGDQTSYNSPFRRRNYPPLTDTFYFSTSGVPEVSKYFTLISYEVGLIGDYGGIYTTTPNSGTLYSTSKTALYVGDGAQPSPAGGGYGLAYRVEVFRGGAQNVSASTMTYSTQYSNNGNWIYEVLIPGKWAIATEAINFDCVSYTPVLAPGRVGLLMIERGGNGSAPITFQTNGYCINRDMWWYNAGDFQMNVNPTANNITLDWAITSTTDSYGNVIQIPRQAPYPLINTPRVYAELYKY